MEETSSIIMLEGVKVAEMMSVKRNGRTGGNIQEGAFTYINN